MKSLLLYGVTEYSSRIGHPLSIKVQKMDELDCLDNWITLNMQSQISDSTLFYKNYHKVIELPKKKVIYG